MPDGGGSERCEYERLRGVLADAVLGDEPERIGGQRCQAAELDREGQLSYGRTEVDKRGVDLSSEPFVPYSHHTVIRRPEGSRQHDIAVTFVAGFAAIFGPVLRQIEYNSLGDAERVRGVDLKKYFVPGVNPVIDCPGLLEGDGAARSGVRFVS